MNRWFRFYDDTINDPKALKLSDKTFRIWVGLLCLASKNEGVLPSFEDMLIMLRIKADKLQPELEKLIEAKLLDHGDDGIVPHNWNRRQYKTDVTDTTNAARQKRYRDKHRNGESNVTDNAVTTVTPKRPDTDNRITERKDDAPSGADEIVFESGRIRLKAKNLSQWENAFVNLDVKAELLGLSQWADTQGNNWFCAVSGALTKRNREVGIRKSAAQKGVPLTPAGTPYPDGII